MKDETMGKFTIYFYLETLLNAHKYFLKTLISMLDELENNKNKILDSNCPTAIQLTGKVFSGRLKKSPTFQGGKLLSDNESIFTYLEDSK